MAAPSQSARPTGQVNDAQNAKTLCLAAAAATTTDGIEKPEQNSQLLNSEYASESMKSLFSREWNEYIMRKKITE